MELVRYFSQCILVFIYGANGIMLSGDAYIFYLLKKTMTNYNTKTYNLSFPKINILNYCFQLLVQILKYLVGWDWSSFVCYLVHWGSTDDLLLLQISIGVV